MPRYTERVEVSRILIDVRALDYLGQPILGLAAGDFRVQVDGRPARVESAHWVGGEAADFTETGPIGATARPVPEEARGRLIVFLFQKDLEPSRIVGLMRMLIQTGEFLESIGPDDRVAVLSFDSRLRVWLDFTNRMERVRRVFEHGILFESPGPVEPASPPSLMTTLRVAQVNRAYSIEESLALLGRALEPLPGAKSVVYVGHGFGQLHGSGVFFDHAYGEARRALQAARAAVFCLDVTDADSHTLEAGLKVTAADTGGFFVRTHLFPGQAMRRLSGALAGFYVLFVEAQSGSPDRRRREIEVELADRDGIILAKRHHLDASPGPGTR